MSAPRPSSELVRSLTDELVLRALLSERRLTRAEIAARTGISKPTASESVRRLVSAGLLRDTGERTTGRGRIGTYYGLSAATGTALVVSIAPEGIAAETVDVHGDVVGRARRAVSRPARPREVQQALLDGARQATVPAGQPRLAVVSAADPVDRASGRLVHLPDAPFLLGDLDPVAVLAPLVSGPVHVDNDVNWAARAERAAAPDPLDDFAYLHLGEGLGCAVVSDGEVRRGASGLAGEVAHIVTTGPAGRARPFTEVFADLGLRLPGSTAIDVPSLLRLVDDTGPRGSRAREALGAALSGVLSAIVSLSDPSAIVLGGTWGSRPVVLETATRAFAAAPRAVPVRASAVADGPSLAGARERALADLRHALVVAAHGATAAAP